MGRRCTRTESDGVAADRVDSGRPCLLCATWPAPGITPHRDRQCHLAVWLAVAARPPDFEVVISRPLTATEYAAAQGATTLADLVSRLPDDVGVAWARRT